MAGQLPEPLRIDGRDMWDRASIDDAIDRLFGRSSAGWEARQPGLQPAKDDWRKRQPGLQYQRPPGSECENFSIDS